MTQNNNAPVLQEQVRLFGFGSDPGIDLPFDFDGTVPDEALKKEYADLGVISEDEGQDYFTGDNVQLAIGQGLLSASPLQLAVGYSTIANYGFVMKPEIIMAIYQPGVPDAHASGYRRPVAGTARRGSERRRRSHPADPDAAGDPQRDQQRSAPCDLRAGHRRATTYHSTTGENLFYFYPSTRHPDRRQDRHRPGRRQLSVERLVGVRRVTADPTRPYTVTAYLEKAGYGSQAAGPVVKCMFMQLSGDAHDRPGRVVRPARHVVEPRRPTAAPVRHELLQRPVRCHDGSRVSGMATSFLSRKPDSGLGNIGASPGDPSRNIDWVLMSAQVALTVIGMFVIFSASRTRIAADPYAFVTRQVVFAIIAVIVMSIVMAFDYEWWKRARRVPLRAHARAAHAAVPARRGVGARTRSPSTSGRSTCSRPRWRSSPRC